MAMANLAMATGNIGRRGVGVNPLRGQNNVQGSCDMGSFPHEFSGYRHVSDDATRDIFERLWGVPLSSAPGLRIPNMMDEAVDGAFKGLYVQGEDIAQSDPDTQHITAGLKAMECVIVQDLFLNETARYAHVFLPGSSFLEKDGTFINAERRISRVRKAIEPLAGKADWEATIAVRRGARRADALYASQRDHGRDRGADPDLRAASPTPSSTSSARCNGRATTRRRRARRSCTSTVLCAARGSSCSPSTSPTEERTGPLFPLLLTTGRILSQYNVGAQTRRTENSRWHEEDVLEIHPFDAESRGIDDGDLVSLQSRVGADRVARASLRAHAARRRLHHVPSSSDRRQRRDHRLLRLGDQLPGIQGDGGAGQAHQPLFRLAGARPRRRRSRNAASWSARRCRGMSARRRFLDLGARYSL